MQPLFSLRKGSENIMSSTKQKVIAVCGPTAVGKTKFAIEIAKRFDGEIVSCDSMQLYKYMDIGSAKPTPEEQAQAVHHLIDCIDPREPFSAAKYANLAKESITDIAGRGKLPIVAGGTGLYLDGILYDLDFSRPPENPKRREELRVFADAHGNEALHQVLQEKDPQAAAHIHPNNVKRVIRAIEIAENGGRWRDFSGEPKRNPDYDILLIGLCRDRAELYDRIYHRVDLLIQAGLVDEVRRLLQMGLKEEHISMKGIGYKEIIGYLNGEYPLDEAAELIKKNTRHFAKRQMTWFRCYKDMHWVNISTYSSEEDCLTDLFRQVDALLVQPLSGSGPGTEGEKGGAPRAERKDTQ